MADKSNVKKISWEELLSRIEKNQGVPKTTVSESFKAARKEIEQTLISDRPGEGEVTMIKTPIAAIISRYEPKHVITDDKGKKWEISESIGIGATPPRNWSDIANTGFECTKKALK